MTELHEKYAPILRFTRGEYFFPMSAGDLLEYCSLYLKGQDEPILPQGQVTPAQLARHGRSTQLFLRSVDQGPLSGADVVGDWGAGALEMVLRWSERQSQSWSESLARKAYSWFSPKTRSATQLFWWNNLISSLLTNALQTVNPQELPRLTLPAATQASAAERYENQAKKSPGYTYYYRQLQDGAYLSLQYWFFYGYNDWGRSFAGFNDHEGDWEGLTLFFRLDRQGRPQEPPAHIAYATHESRLTKPWGHPDITCVGLHPVGYVGAGSHATYPQAKIYDVMGAYGLLDRATGDGLTIDHDQWRHRIDLDDAAWLQAYQGSWGARFWLSTTSAKALLQIALAATPLSGLIGLAFSASEIELPGVSAPRGPLGPDRAQYANPVSWAGLED